MDRLRHQFLAVIAAIWKILPHSMLSMGLLLSLWAVGINQSPAQMTSTDSADFKPMQVPLMDSAEYLRSIHDYLAVVREQMSDKAFTLDRRESIASETLGMLRFRISEAPQPEDALKVWAILIDTAVFFSSKHPNHPMAERFQLTVAEAWWQRSRLLSRIQAATNPNQTKDVAKTDRDQAIAILEALVKKNPDSNDPQSQMSRYLLAQCLSDQVVAERDSGENPQRRERIVKLTEKLDAESIQDWALLMRVRSLAETGKIDLALTDLERVSQAFRHRYTSAWAEVKVAVLIMARQWQQADEFMRMTDLPLGLLARLEMELCSARWIDSPNELEKKKIQETVFQSLEKIREKDDTDAILAKLQVSRSGITPPDDCASQWWEWLAECHFVAGQIKMAAESLDHAVQRAQIENQAKHVVQLQFQSGAAWYRAGEPNIAQNRMLAVLQNPDLDEIGAKASLIRVMSLKAMGISGQAFLNEAIATHLERFQDEKLSTGEVRWIEGEQLVAQGKREEAIQAWSAIPPGHARWLAASLSMMKLDLEVLDNLILVADNRGFATRWDTSRRRLERARDQTSELAEKLTLELAIARVDLTPGSDRADAARQAVLRLQPKLTRDSQRQWAECILILADALLGRSLDLETRLRARDLKMDDSLVLDMCRVLDTQASIIDTEGIRKQLGGTMARLAESLPANSTGIGQDDNGELELRKIRGLIYAGQPSLAEPRMDAWLKAHPDISPSLLFAVSDALLRLNATAKAISYLRIWLSQEPEGGTPWFLGRLELAKALYREGRDKEAARLIDATLVLYPEAGGIGLKRKFDALRRSIKY